jgi:hypothetical protein
MNAAIDTDFAFPKSELALMRDRYERDGFIQIDTLTTAADIAAIRSLVEPLFAEFSARPGNSPQGRPGYAEINDALALAPGLRNTRAYARCRVIARSLLGVPVGDIFDHAIYKPPHYEIATLWHQDEIYNKAPMPQRAVNFWIPLQAASIENGCLRFLPGSHRDGLRPHHSSSPNEAKLALDSVDEAHAVACQVGLGGATAHDPLTAHYAGPNCTNAPRTAWVLHFGAYGKWRYKAHPRAIIAKLRAIARR